MQTTCGDGILRVQSLNDHITAQDYPPALKLVARHGAELARLHGTALRAAILRMPRPLWRENPAVFAAIGASYGAPAEYGIGNHDTGAPPCRAAAMPWLGTAELLVRRDGAAAHSPTLLPHILLLLASARRGLGLLTEAGEAAEEASRLLDADLAIDPLERITLQARAAAQRGLLLLHSGHYESARRELSLAVSLGVDLSASPESGLGPSEFLEYQAGLALASALAGDLGSAATHTALARSWADECARELPGIGPDSDSALLHAPTPSRLLSAHYGAASVLAEALGAALRLRLSEASALAPALAEASRHEEWQPLARYAQAALACLRGRPVEALSLARRAAEAAHHWQGEPAVRPLVADFTATLYGRLGEPEPALAAAAASSDGELHERCTNRHRAGALLRRGDPHGCLEAIAACETALEGHASPTLLEVLLLGAAARYELDAVSAADLALDRALHLAAGTGLRAPFLALPPATLHRMLVRAAERAQPPLTQAMLEELRADDAPTPLPGPDTLSERELMIVSHLSLDKTVNQIAAELFISANTVKTHVRSIYRKLDASSRREALHRIRELGLDRRITPGSPSLTLY